MSLSLIDFTNLKKLYLSSCNEIKDKDIEKLVNLEVICIKYNLNSTHDAFKNFSKIKMLVLKETNITSNVLKYLPNIKVWKPEYIYDEDNYEYLKNVKKIKNIRFV